MSPKVAFVYPGQGTQRVGMGAWLSREVPLFSELCDLLSGLLGFDLATLCRRGPEPVLRQTAAAQAAIFAVSVAGDAYARGLGWSPAIVAGHSLGEITALYGSGMLELEDAARLVVARGTLMGSVPEHGTMAALRGMEAAAVDVLLQEAGRYGCISLGARNAAAYWAVSGQDAAVQHATTIARASGARVTPLATSGAFHSPLMEPILDEWRQVVAKTPLRDGQVPLVLNLDGTITTSAARVREALVQQMTAPVRWHECVTTLCGHVDLAVECGDSKVLTSLSRQTLLRMVSMSDTSALRRLRDSADQMQVASS